MKKEGNHRLLYTVDKENDESRGLKYRLLS